MDYETIISKMTSNEGFPVAQELLARIALVDIRTGADLVYQYDDVVFTVDADEGVVHLYSLGTSSLLSATRRFMRDVWKTGLKELYAPILNEKLESAAKRFGWKLVKTLPTGHRLYAIRSMQ